MVKEFFKPASIDEALDLLAAPGALALAGGTWALAFEARDKPERVVDIGKAVPRSIEKRGSVLVLGAGATFQEIIESTAVPAVIKAAAASMANRNTRNRATVGGNLGANKSCASLVPVLLALGATVEAKSRGKPAAVVPLADWLAKPEGLVLTVSVPVATGVRAASLRSSRTACDIATGTAACAYRLDSGKITGLRLAVGGFGPHAVLRPDLAGLFEGKPLPPKADIEKAVLPLLSARADLRGSAEYKQLRGAALLADALHAAEELS
jgi:CO/xanthine dehydrogenase FAD-binding subunit